LEQAIVAAWQLQMARGIIIINGTISGNKSNLAVAQLQGSAGVP